MIVRRLGLAALALLAGLAEVRPGRAALLGHGGPVRAVAVAADGQTAVTGGFDYSLIVWRLADETPLRHLIGHDGPVNGVALTPDGRQAVSASDDGTVVVWDLASGAVLRRFDVGVKLGTVALSPDGALAAAGGWDGRVHLWHLADGAHEPPLEAGGERVTALSFTAGGARLVAGGHEGSLRAWRLPGREPMAPEAAHGFGLTALAVLPHGGGLVSGSIDRSLRLWPSGESLAGHDQPVVALAASPDGRLLASAGARGEVLLWDLAEHRVRLVLAGAGPTIWALAFTPDSRRLLGGGADAAVRVWDAATGEALGRPVPAPEATEPGRGPELFAACSACHTFTPDGGNRAGPTLLGLFGRRAGAVPGYPYSHALRASDVVWTEATVSRLFELGPDRFLPGSRMPLQRMPSARDRAELIAYMKRMGGG